MSDLFRDAEQNYDVGKQLMVLVQIMGSTNQKLK